VRVDVVLGGGGGKPNCNRMFYGIEQAGA